MIKVSKVADSDITTKIDLAQLETYLNTLGLGDTFVCIICTVSTFWHEDKWDEDGYANYMVKIPHNKIRDSDEPFELIREEVDKRLRQTA